MTTAIGDMQTAYTDAAGRKSPNFLNYNTGDLTGRTLTHGLYKWSTNVLVSSGGVTSQVLRKMSGYFRLRELSL